MEQILDFFLDCDVVLSPRYEDATKIAREIRKYVEEHDKPPPE